MRYDKSRCIENIYALAKEKKLKIGEMEEKAGVSKGYLSRINKEDSTANPSIELLVSVADQLGVSVDYLIGFNGEMMSENEELIIAYIDKLLKNTCERKLEWILQTRNILTSENGNAVDNPLIDIESNYDEFNMRYQEHVFKSHFYSDRAQIIGDCYYCIPTNGCRIFLMNVRYYDFFETAEDENALNRRSKVEYKDTFELYMETRQGVSSICSTAFVRKEIVLEVCKLYEAINNTTSRIGLTANTRQYMRVFLNLGRGGN